MTLHSQFRTVAPRIAVLLPCRLPWWARLFRRWRIRTPSTCRLLLQLTSMTLALRSLGNGSVGSYSLAMQGPNYPLQTPNLLNSAATLLVLSPVGCSGEHFRRQPVSSSDAGERGSLPAKSVGELHSPLPLLGRRPLQLRLLRASSSSMKSCRRAFSTPLF